MRSIRQAVDRRRIDGDEGFTLILVIGFSLVLLGVVGLASTLGINSLRSSRSHVNFENALSTAEAGIDDRLAAVSTAFNAVPSTNYVTPAPCAVSTLPAVFGNDEQERVMARDALLALPASCTVSTGSGDYVAVRPTNKRAVYSLGWYPGRSASGAARRLVKAEYLLAPYKPSNAVLTQGSLDFSGSVTVRALNTTSSADIHTNTAILGYNSSLNMAGHLSTVGTLPGGCPAGVTGGCAAGAAIQTLPTVSARTYYRSQAVALGSNWYDLCAGGVVRRPNVVAGSLPCSGPNLGVSPYNGWEYTAGSGTTAPLWTLPRTAGGPYGGVYYVYQGDANIGDNGNSPTTWPITVLAESAATGGSVAHCGKLGGNVNWKLFNLTPALPGLQLLADADLKGEANATAGSGLFLAGDKVDLNTSSATITGAVIASNRCAAAGPNTVQGVTVNYDDTLESPLSDVIRTTLWLEYPAG